VGTALQIYRPHIVTTVLDVATQAASKFRENSKSSSTRKAYADDWKQFSEWCHQSGVDPLPASPLVVGAYLSTLATANKSVSTIGRRLAAIREYHRAAGMPVPKSDELSATLSGIRRTLGTAPTRQKAPATADVLVTALSAIGDRTIKDVRDRAILALGFAAALRRSELVALDASDIEFVPEGMRVRVRRSKTDQAGAGAEIAVPLGNRLLPAAAVRKWLQVSGVTSGPLFRRITRGGQVTSNRLGARNVATIVKQCLSRLGLDKAMYSGHSLRSGFVTTACAHNVNLFRIADVTRHKQLATLKLYDR
jgi:site-specific recombinase XerD